MPLTDKERSRLRSPFRKRCHAVWTGELLEITYLPKDKEYRRPGKRGKIKGFSRSARLRMLRMIASINWSNVRNGLFITLTYPDEHADRAMGERSTDKYLFLRYMEKYLGKKVGVIWRIEWEPRKSGKRLGVLTAHWHLIVFGVRFIPKELIKQWWQLVLRADGNVVTWIDGIESGKKLARYVGKYCSKLPDASVLDNASYLNNLGRHWGIARRELVPWFPRFVIPFLSAKDIDLCENLACMTFKFFTRKAEQGFQVFGTNAIKVGEILFERMLDIENNPA
jgi:hypothetical protein